MSAKIRVLACLLACLAICGCTGKQPASHSAPRTPVELHISAAVSLSDSLKEIQPIFEQKYAGIKLIYNTGASGTLQQQVEQGAPADLFISAGTKQADALKSKGLLDEKWHTTLLRNELVLIVPAGAVSGVGGLEDLAKPSVKKIAVGDPAAVPAGEYARQVLTGSNLWDVLQPKIVFGKDVRQLLTYVETGNADAAFVYKTDAQISKSVSSVLTAPASSHKPIEYPMAILAASKQPEQAQAFYNFLMSPEARDIFIKYGFTAVEKS